MEDRQQALIWESDRGYKARQALELLQEWLDSFSEWTIASLKTCPEQEMARYRNLLLASEAFKAKLEADVIAGIEANKEIDFLSELEKEDDRWY